MISRRTLIHLTLIVVFAAVLRAVKLDSAPVGGDGDAAWFGIHTLDWLDRGITPYYIRELYAPEPTVIYLMGAALPFTGISYLTSRVVTVIAGLLLVALLYPAAWWLLGDQFSPEFRQRAGLLASLAAATSLHANYLSRLGIHGTMLPAAIALLTWLTASAWRTGSYRRWVLAGVALAFTQYIYIPARVLPLALALWIGYSALTERERLKQQWRGWLLMALVAFVLTLPNIIIFIRTPEAFSARADIGSAATGGWVWQYDTSHYGGALGLVLQKISLTLAGLGITWHGPHINMNQPMLGPLFFVGFLLAIGAWVRFPRRTVYGWAFLAIPIMLLPDLISGAVLEAHADHQIGVLPFVFLLAGIGLAHSWEIAANIVGTRYTSSVQKQRVIGGVFITLALLPALIGTYRYLYVFIPAQYADPETSWRHEQADVDLSGYIVSQPERAYLLPYEEYSRSNVAWLVSAAFRERRSAIDANGKLNLPNPPAEITVVMPTDPYRIRHDGHESQFDTRLWVLLYDGTTWLLPPLTPTQEAAILGAQKRSENLPVIDRSQTTIAHVFTIRPLADLFAPRPVIDYPLDATFNDEIRLLGYTLANPDLTPGKVIFVTLFWQALKPPSDDYQVFIQLWDDQKNALVNTTEFPYEGLYRTNIWRTTEVIATHHWLRLPKNLPVGRYTLAAGLYRVLQKTALSVVGVNTDSEGAAALAPDLRVALPALTETGTPPPQPLQFGDVFRVIGLNAALDGQELEWGCRGKACLASTSNAKPGQTLTVSIAWEALRRPPVDYSLFLHLSASDDQPPMAQADLTLGGALPSGAWRAGDRVRDTATLKLPDDLPPGRYTVWLGVYFWQTNERLPPLLDGVEQPNGRLRLATLVIPEKQP